MFNHVLSNPAPLCICINMLALLPAHHKALAWLPVKGLQSRQLLTEKCICAV